MSFVAPFWLGVAGLVAAGVVIAHLFSTNVPPSQVLPTVGFVPKGALMAVVRTRRLTDVALLILRVLAVMLLGLALAGAHVPRSGPSRVLVVDASRAVAEAGRTAEDAVDAVDAVDAEDTEIIVFDSVARAVDASVLDTLTPSQARGSLSAGIVAAHRAIANVSRGRGEIELVIVSPVARETVDSATARLIALWEGPVHIERVPAASLTQPMSFQIRALGDDPVVASLATEHPPGPVGVRIVRDTVTVADSLWAREAGRALVTWPSQSSAPLRPPRSAILRSGAGIDTVEGFSSAGQTVIGSFARTHAPSPGRVIARWIDGQPSATESALGDGCVREVAIPVDPVGDVALRESFRGFVRSLLEPCGGARDFAAVPDSLLLPRERKPAAASVASIADSRLPVILALLALVVLATEQALRRQGRGSA